MGKSRIYYLGVTTDYTDQPTHVRVYKEPDYGIGEPEDAQYVWCVDAVDDVGNYTEDVGRFRTWEQAMAAVPEFVHLNPLYTYWALGRTVSGQRYRHPVESDYVPPPGAKVIAVPRDSDPPDWTEVP